MITKNFRRMHLGETKWSRKLEKFTSAFPSSIFLWLAGGSVLGSLLLRIFGRKDESLFVGHWVPTLLILGLWRRVWRSLED